MASTLILLVFVLVISAATTNVDASKCSPGWATCNNGRSCRTNVWSDRNNCGQCGSKCARPHATSKCKMGRCSFECDEKHGWCDCDGKHFNGCEVNTQTDKNNCGACGLVCPAPANSVASCVKGVCKKKCKYGYKQCDNSCVKVANDVNNCGGCGIVCHGGANGTALCVGGRCDVQCQAGSTKCASKCVNVGTDVTNCGRCGTVCSGANGRASCVGGECGLDCSSGYTKCNGKCVDLNTDVVNCGLCETKCPEDPNGKASCVGGKCGLECDPGYTECNGACVNFNTDFRNCGGCGRYCDRAYSNQCIGGTCLCEPEIVSCNGTLVDLTSQDFSNCGSCGGVCDLSECPCGWCFGVKCFPGDATVTLASGGTKRMFDLVLGDEVAVRGRNGGVAYEDVYAFGHRDALSFASFVQLTVKPVDGDVPDSAAKSRTVELTAFHFVPVSAGVTRTLTYKRAQDVIVGDRMWADGSAAVEVTAISQVHKQGLYKPFTLGGTIIVNGVVASTHSGWFLDGMFETLGVVEWLPWAYQALLLPVRMMYYVLGKDAYLALYRWLDAVVDVAAFSGKHGGCIATAAAAVALFAMAKASRRA